MDRPLRGGGGVKSRPLRKKKTFFGTFLKMPFKKKYFTFDN